MADDRRPDALGLADAAEIVSVLSESFFDYPVMRFILGSEPEYSNRLEQLIEFFVMSRVLKRETLLGIRGAGGLAAAALVSFPGRDSGPDPLLELRDATWAELGQLLIVDR